MMHHKPGYRPIDMDHFLGNFESKTDYDYDIVILSTGFEGKLQVPEETVEHLKVRGVSLVRAMQTVEALDYYRTIRQKEVKVAFFVHSTC
jgi:hypothetical protein